MVRVRGIPRWVAGAALSSGSPILFAAFIGSPSPWPSVVVAVGCVLVLAVGSWLLYRRRRWVAVVALLLPTAYSFVDLFALSTNSTPRVIYPHVGFHEVPLIPVVVALVAALILWRRSVLRNTVIVACVIVLLTRVFVFYFVVALTGMP